MCPGTAPPSTTGTSAVSSQAEAAAAVPPADVALPPGTTEAPVYSCRMHVLSSASSSVRLLMRLSQSRLSSASAALHEAGSVQPPPLSARARPPSSALACRCRWHPGSPGCGR